MEDYNFVLIFGIAVLVFAGNILYRVFVDPEGNEEDIERYENGSFWTRRRYERSDYVSARLAKSIRDHLDMEEPGKFEIPDWAKGDEETSKADAWKCPDCGRLNHGFQDTCTCGCRKDT